jgi:hypothetical protein
MSNEGFEIHHNDVDGTAPIPPADARTRMHEEYIKLRTRWFPEEFHAQPATFQWLLLAEGSDDLDWGYSHPSRLLRVVVNEADLQVGHFTNFPPEADPHEIYENCAFLPGTWRVFLVHELCHEYQFVVLNDVANEWGTQMFAERGANWPGPGHTAVFYTAIQAFAQRFGLDADQLVVDL